MSENSRPEIKAFALLLSLFALGCFYGAGASAAPYDPESALRLANLDLNYPGAGLRYFFSGSAALEMRVQYEKNTTVAGARLYLFSGRFKKKGVVPYAGVEADYASFKGDYAGGRGCAGGVFAGVEYFLGESLSAQTDVGTSYLFLKDADTALVQNGLEFILNLGVNIYFLTY